MIAKCRYLVSSPTNNVGSKTFPVAWIKMNVLFVTTTFSKEIRIKSENDKKNTQWIFNLPNEHSYTCSVVDDMTLAVTACRDEEVGEKNKVVTFYLSLFPPRKQRRKR